MTPDQMRRAELLALNIVHRRIEERLQQDWDISLAAVLRIEHERALEDLRLTEIDSADKDQENALRAHAALVIDGLLVGRGNRSRTSDPRY